MSKYIDLFIKTDIQVDTIKQSTLKIGSESVAIIPTSEVNSTLQYESGSWKYTNHGISKELSKTLLPSANRISFTGADLVNGKLIIQHNLGFKYILGLDYTIMPRNITFVDENTLELDYSDQPSTISGDVWFLQSNQNMFGPSVSTIKQGLLAYWSLDDVENDSVYDSQNRFQLISDQEKLKLSGGRSGRIGKTWATSSDSNARLYCNVTIDPNEYSSKFTLNVWFWIPGGQIDFWKRLIGIESTNGNDLGAFGIFANQNGHTVFAPSDGRSSLWTDSINSDAGKTGKWVMVTGVFDNGLAKLYIDGTLVASKTDIPKMTSSGSPALFSDVNGQVGMVKIDEAGFWNRALTEREITLLFNNGKGVNPITYEQGTDDPGISDDGLIVFLPLDSTRVFGGEGGWNSLQMVYTGINFSVQDGVPCIDKTNSYSAFKLTPVDKLPTGESPFTVSFWSKCSTEGSVGEVETFNITFGASNGTGAFYIGVSATGFTVNSWASESTMKAIGTTVENGTKWHHYVFRYTETGGELWIDGEKKTESSGRYSINPQYCTIFGRYWANHGAAFTGAMSSLRIYGRALSENEIKVLAKEFTPTA